MSKEEKKVNRRDFLFTASYTIGAVGLGAVVWPLVHQMNPDKAQQALATTEVDISQVEPGNSITVLWRGKPIFLKRRTADEIAEARAVSMTDLPDPQKDEDRVKEGKDDFGYNARTDKYESLLKSGVIDPTKVSRSALENAASIASMLLTTECVVADEPEDDMPAPPMGGGMPGGMPGMM